METEIKIRRTKAERFQTVVAALPKVPEGFEYKRFYGQPVLFPATGSEPIRPGTGLTETQLDVALNLQRFRNIIPSEAFTRLMLIREARLRGLE